MTVNALLQIGVHFAALLALIKPVGIYMARVYEGRVPWLERMFGPIERRLYRLCGIDPSVDMTWRQYAQCVLALGFAGFCCVYLIQRIQSVLPLNPDGKAGVAAHSAFNVAASFVTNTNWQCYAGEQTMSHFTQMAALTVQNFISAATGMAVLIALIRGFTRQKSECIGNFWVDHTRGILYILLPFSTVLAVALATTGVVQTLQTEVEVRLTEPTTDGDGRIVETQRIALGPAASQVAIKQLGANGGGFFNANSCHPLENPTPISNFLEWIAILLIPAALCYSFGEIVGNRRQGWSILAAKGLIFVPAVFIAAAAEQRGNPAFDALSVDRAACESQSGGNMEGKETRFGIVDSALWAMATTAASNGSVNGMHDSLMPAAGALAIANMVIGEVVFGGVGSGLYGMIVFVIVTVFISGLLVGRTPECLGKKIGAFEMKMAALAILFPGAAVLLGTVAAIATEAGTSAISNPGPHGFSEALYAVASAGNNNGSAFAGLNANNPFYNGLLGMAMLIGRYWVIVPVLAIAGSLASRKRIPAGAGTLSTDSALFVTLLAAIVILVGALSFLPALALGPIAEQFTLISTP